VRASIDARKVSSPFQKARIPCSTAGKEGDGVTPSVFEVSG
jgi:hypothetical protein